MKELKSSTYMTGAELNKTADYRSLSCYWGSGDVIIVILQEQALNSTF